MNDAGIMMTMQQVEKKKKANFGLCTEVISYH